MSQALCADTVFAPAFAELDDAALLAHYRGPRPVWLEAVLDAEETRPERIDALLQGDFAFNGEHHHLPEPLDWLTNPSRDVEWHILLHKFYYAPGLGQAWQRSGDARYLRRWQQLLEGWMASTPVGFIAADVTGRRVQNWIYSLQAFVFDGGAPMDGAFLRRVIESLHAQVEFLCTHLTPKRNHRTLELMAIMLAGVALPELAHARHWREFALAETVANLQADLLPDGVHCELSTDYHHLALRNWLQVRELAARNGLPVPVAMDAALQRGFEFSLHVHQPSGLVPSLSDGDVHSYRPLLAQAAALYRRDDLLFVARGGAEGRAPARRVAHFPHAGYHVLRSDWRSAPGFEQAQHLVLDCGPLGEGNHGHFDALSFELAANGRALVVDPGRYTYSEAGDVNWRVHFRSTAAHNTVCVDGQSQTRYEPRPVKGVSRHAAGQVRHRVAGPAPATRLLDAAESPQLDLLHGRAVSAEVDVVHERVVVFIDQRFWIVSDSLRSPSPHHYAMRLQLAAAAQGRCTLQHGLLHSPDLQVAVAAAPGQTCVLEDAWVSTRYGHKDPAPRLCCGVLGGDVDFDAVLLPDDDTGHPPSVQRVAVEGAAHALRIEGVGTQDDRGQVHTWFHVRSGKAADAQVAEVPFHGRWLHLRHAADGRLLAATTHAGARLDLPEGVHARFIGSDAGLQP